MYWDWTAKGPGMGTGPQGSCLAAKTSAVVCTREKINNGPIQVLQGFYKFQISNKGQFEPANIAVSYRYDGTLDNQVVFMGYKYTVIC